MIIKAKWMLKLIILTCLGILSPSCNYALAEQTLTAAELQAQQAKLKILNDFVDSGLAYLKKYGKEKAYKEFSNTKGQFRKGELFLFVYNYQGVNLAHGADPAHFIGKNLLNYRGKYDTPVIMLLINVAKRGGGYLHYYWTNPDSNQLQFKTTYVKPIDNNTLIGSGVYENIEVPQTKYIRIEELKSFVNEAIEYYKQNGEVKALAEFNKPNGKFSRKTMTIFMGNYQGVCLADGGDPAIVGRNDYNLTDNFGTPFVQMFIETAKNGGGVVTYYRTLYGTNITKMKTAYIKSLTNNSFIGAGYYEK